MKIYVGSYVRIASDFPSNRTLQNQTGNIVALPNVEHPDEYLVKLDGGITLSPHLVGMIVRVPAGSLEMANQIRYI
jgi:hypothetical protein